MYAQGELELEIYIYIYIHMLLCPGRTGTRTNTNPNDTEANAVGRRGVSVCSANGTCENQGALVAKSLTKSEALVGGVNSGNAQGPSA